MTADRLPADHSAAAAATRRARVSWQDRYPRLVADVLSALGRAEGVVFTTRLDIAVADLIEALATVYGEASDIAALCERGVRQALAAAAERPEELRLLDRRREVDREWFQRQRMLGYVCYTERFCGTLAQLPRHIDYLAELGVTYLHLMPLLQPRPGENDGGYAVIDYRAVDPRLGTMRDLEDVATALRARDMSLCVDVVLNHTAREHQWARGWLAGDAAYADFYTAFPDRDLPDAFDATIPSVFPDRAPGSFTWVEAALDGVGGWVWTTFWPYQWDLNYANPDVLLAMLGEILWLANRGIEIFRMDAVPFLWKRLGTNGMNQPEAHAVMQALNGLVRLAAPATVFKAEAIVSPEDLVPYLGGHERYRPQCELAYHNQLMVMLWSSLATKEAQLARHAVGRMDPIPPGTSWVTYVRCHDDIGWAVSDADAASMGWSGFTHRRFLNDFYSGRYDGSFARGALFQQNAVTGDARISGTTAALCGIEDALERGDAAGLERGVRRLVLLYSVIYAFGGVPLLYMGDELALLNDRTYLADPALAADNRWTHRPWMDWTAAARRIDPATLEGRVFGWLRLLGATRRDVPALRGGADNVMLDVGSSSVLAWRRRHPRSGHFVGLANVSESDSILDLAALSGLGRLEPVLGSDPVDVIDGRLRLPGLGFHWLAEP